MAAADQPPQPARPPRWARFGAVELDARAGELHAATARYIETLPRRGYRWLVPVTWADARA